MPGSAGRAAFFCVEREAWQPPDTKPTERARVRKLIAELEHRSKACHTDESTRGVNR